MGQLGQIINDGINIFPIITNLSIMCCLNFNEGTIYSRGDSSSQFSFTTSSGSFHQYIFRNDFLLKLFAQFFPSDSISVCYCQNFFSSFLGNHMLIKIIDDLFWCEVNHGIIFVLFDNEFFRKITFRKIFSAFLNYIHYYYLIIHIFNY